MNAAGILQTLKSKGQPMTLTRSKASTQIFDPVAGAVEFAETETFTVYGITTNYNSFTKISAQNNPDSLIQSGDKKAIISAGVTEPVPGDSLTIMGKVWAVIAVDTLAPQGVNLMHTCQVRL